MFIAHGGLNPSPSDGIQLAPLSSPPSLLQVSTLLGGRDHPVPFLRSTYDISFAPVVIFLTAISNIPRSPTSE